MSSPELKPLPSDFIWGVSASGYQSEGGNVDSNWDRYNAAAPDQDRYGSSVDFRHRYREDVSLAKDLGVNTFRIGINWARVEPRKGEFDEAELAYYDDVVLAMKQAGIAPLITLDHFVYPGWVADQGAWTNPRTTEDFVRFSRLIAERYHRDVKLWLTFNEAAFFMIIEWKYRKMKWAQVKLMSRHVISAHRQVYDLIHQLDDGAMVSSNIVWAGEGLRSRLLQWFTDRLFINGVLDKIDCMAIDYYYRGLSEQVLKGRIWEADPCPSGLGRALKKLAKRRPPRGCPAGLHLLGAARPLRGRQCHRLHVLEPHRQLRVGPLWPTLRSLYRQRADRPGTQAHPHRGRRGVPADHPEPRRGERPPPDAGLIQALVSPGNAPESGHRL